MKTFVVAAVAGALICSGSIGRAQTTTITVTGSLHCIDQGLDVPFDHVHVNLMLSNFWGQLFDTNLGSTNTGPDGSFAFEVPPGSYALEVAAGRVPIVAGATSNSTHDAVEKAKEVAGRSGVNAILTASPYYNKPTQEGQYRHFRAIAEAVDKPIILYNVPGRTGANIEPATLSRLAEVPNIAGVKEASGNMTQIAEVCNAVPENFLVFSGDDAITLPVIALGGVGIISVASNEIPREMSEMTRAALNNDWGMARRNQRKYLPLMQANFLESNPLPVKAVLAMMGKIEEVYRLPLLPMRRDTRSRLQKIATEAGLITRPAAPPAEAAEFYIYENWLAGPHKIVLHRSTCSQCNHGKGRPAGHDPNHSRWHGPYATLAETREASHNMTSVLIRSECKCV